MGYQSIDNFPSSYCNKKLNSKCGPVRNEYNFMLNSGKTFINVLRLFSWVAVVTSVSQTVVATVTERISARINKCALELSNSDKSLRGFHTFLPIIIYINLRVVRQHCLTRVNFVTTPPTSRRPFPFPPSYSNFRESNCLPGRSLPHFLSMERLIFHRACNHITL